MLYDLNWLKEGQIFPPQSEIERLSSYRDSRELFKGNTEVVLANYQQRINDVAAKLDLNTTFKTDVNYHRLLTVKTADLVCGEMPDISIANGTDIKELCRVTKLKKKLYEAVCDVSRLGDSIARVYYKESTHKYDFVIMEPDKWFPIVNRENVKEPIAHCLAWTEETPDSSKYNPKYVLKVQIHEVGRYINRVYELKNPVQNTPFILNNPISQSPQHTRTVNIKTFTIGKEITPQGTAYVPTGLKKNAIIMLQNLTMPESIYGYNDYDPITSLVAELEVRLMLENAVLDKHTAPTIYADDKNFGMNPITKQMEFATGKGVIVEKDGTVPGYMVWDASLQANHEMIKTLKELLYSITEMGAVINDDAFGASQGYEALMTRLTSARMKARRISDNLTDSVSDLIELLSTRGYDGQVKAEDISIVWNDGIPDTELQNIDIATKKLSLFPIKDILMTHFGTSEEKADELIDMLMEERAALNLGNGFSVGVGGNGE